LGSVTGPQIALAQTTRPFAEPIAAPSQYMTQQPLSRLPDAPPQGDYLDLDNYLDHGPVSTVNGPEWQVLPSSLIYKSYLAGVKESRFGSVQNYIKGDGWVWDATLGTRVGLIRYGDRDPQRPNGFQVDAEGSAQARFYVPSDVDLGSVDFRGGLPLTWGFGAHRFKFGYYHLSSHLGDEFLLKNPNYPRLNFARDVLMLGYSYYAREDLRIYAETGWAFYTDISEPWEFQFGIDYAPARPTGFHGAPFFAVNGHLRQEVNFGGNFVAQAGWAWLSDENAKLFRIGVQYFNGKSNQFSFYNDSQQQLGIAVWYDF
jgi:hypothetical protein